MTIDPGVVIAVIGTLAAAIGGIVRLVYADLRRDRDFWRDMALNAAKNNERAIEVAAKVTKDA